MLNLPTGLHSVYRLPVFHLEFPLRHLYQWAILAENRWAHFGRKLTASSPQLQI
jgi:hypothetical protein